MQQPIHESATPDPAPKQTEPTLQEAAAQVLAAARRQLAELLELFTLEMSYSGLMLGSAIALAAIAALALFSVWGLLLAATATGLLTFGWSWTTVLIVLAAANVLLVFASLWLMRRSLARIGIERTRHALGLDVSHVSE